jgi:hypothetical protein
VALLNVYGKTTACGNTVTFVVPGNISLAISIAVSKRVAEYSAAVREY